MRRWRTLLLILLTIAALGAGIVYDRNRIKGEPVYSVENREALESVLRRDERMVLLPEEYLLPQGETAWIVESRGRMRWDKPRGYRIIGGEDWWFSCYIPYPDEREVPGRPGYMTMGNGSVYWEASPPIAASVVIGQTPVELKPLPKGWQARFVVEECQYTLCWTEETVTQEDLLDFCRGILD